MENKIVITPEIVKKATDYIPLSQKQEMAEAIAQKCIVKVLVNYTETGDGTDSVAMPDRYQEYHAFTNMYLMGILAHEYLHVPYEGDEGNEGYDHLKMPLNVYDTWGASHVMNQLEQMKTDRELREKVFDLLSDYKDFRWMLSHEIDILLGHDNDVVTRLMQMVNATVQANVADALKEVGNTLASERQTAAEEPAGMPKEIPAESIAKASEELKRLRELKERMETVEQELHRKIEEAKERNQQSAAVKEGLHIVE